MKRVIYVLLTGILAILLLGCSALESVMPTAATPVPTNTPEPTPTSEPTPTPTPTPEPTPTPVPTPDPAVWASVLYGGTDYLVSISEVGADARERVTVTLLCPELGAGTTYVGGKPIYPVQLRIEAGGRTYEWLTATRDGDAIVFCFGTKEPPTAIIAYPAYTKDDALSVRFDGTTLKTIQ